MPDFILDGHDFTAEDCVDGVLIDPDLPDDFDDTPNDERPDDQAKWWDRPYIQTETTEDRDASFAGLTGEHAESARERWRQEGRAKWLAAWPSGTRYTVRCLDGGAWDRSTNWGNFSTLQEAIDCAKAGRPWG